MNLALFLALFSTKTIWFIILIQTTKYLTSKIIIKKNCKKNRKIKLALFCKIKSGREGLYFQKVFSEKKIFLAKGKKQKK